MSYFPLLAKEKSYESVLSINFVLEPFVLSSIKLPFTAVEYCLVTYAPVFLEYFVPSIQYLCADFIYPKDTFFKWYPWSHIL